MRLDNGQMVLGRIIPPKQVEKTLKKLGVAEGGPKVPADVHERVMEGQTKQAVLSNGWKIKRVRVGGEWRMELLGPEYTHATGTWPARSR